MCRPMLIVISLSTLLSTVQGDHYVLKFVDGVTQGSMACKIENSLFKNVLNIKPEYDQGQADMAHTYAWLREKLEGNVESNSRAFTLGRVVKSFEDEKSVKIITNAPSAPDIKFTLESDLIQIHGLTFDKIDQAEAGTRLSEIVTVIAWIQDITPVEKDKKSLFTRKGSLLRLKATSDKETNRISPNGTSENLNRASRLNRAISFVRGNSKRNLTEGSDLSKQADDKIQK